MRPQPGWPISPGWPTALGGRITTTDGDLDLAVVNSGFADRLFTNGGSGTFAEVATTAGLGDTGTGRGMAWADYDGDGDMDLYVATATGETNLLYKNNGNTNKWLHVKLTGVANNRSGIGTVVTAVTGATRQRRQVSGGDGYQSQGSLPVEFGFGSTATVDSLIVEWPAGFTTVQTSVATNQTLSITEPAAAFTEVGATAGVNDSGIGTGAAWGDYDGDGDPDLYLVNGAANKLYRNDGAGSFTDITVSPLDDVGYGTQVALADYDNDGDLDIYVVNQSATAVPNRLFKNDGSGTFTEVGAAAGVDDGGDGRGGAWGDYDGDGDLDLYVANVVAANKLYSNDGDGTFTGASAAPVNDANDGVSTSWGDYDNDGDLDLYLTNFTNVANKLFQNNGSGTFTEVGAAAGGDDNGSGQGASWGDYDNDGDLDLYLAQGGPNRLFQNNGDGTFNQVGAGAGVADTETGDGMAWADYDGDGDLDLYVTNFNSKPNPLYKNNGNSNRWLHLKLTGVANNKSAIGTLVTAVTSSTRQQRYVDGGSGYLSQPSLPVEFGFGSTTTVDSLIVDWADGFHQSLTSVATNQVLSLTETFPTITSISPTSGNVGTSVTITGTNFDPTPANNTVFFDPIEATVTAASATSLTVTVPSGAGFGPISVTVSNRTAISTDFFLPTFSGTSPTISASTLAAKVDFTAGTDPTSVAIGDLDGDGKPDLVWPTSLLPPCRCFATRALLEPLMPLPLLRKSTSPL